MPNEALVITLTIIGASVAWIYYKYRRYLKVPSLWFRPRLVIVFGFFVLLLTITRAEVLPWWFATLCAVVAVDGTLFRRAAGAECGNWASQPKLNLQRYVENLRSLWRSLVLEARRGFGPWDLKFRKDAPVMEVAKSLAGEGAGRTGIKLYLVAFIGLLLVSALAGILFLSNSLATINGNHGIFINWIVGVYVATLGPVLVALWFGATAVASLIDSLFTTVRGAGRLRIVLGVPATFAGVGTAVGLIVGLLVPFVGAALNYRDSATGSSLITIDSSFILSTSGLAIGLLVGLLVSIWRSIMASTNIFYRLIIAIVSITASSFMVALVGRKVPTRLLDEIARQAPSKPKSLEDCEIAIQSSTSAREILAYCTQHYGTSPLPKFEDFLFMTWTISIILFIFLASHSFASNRTETLD